ncbi:hypothetical protein PO435_22165, partial [Escherichia coli]
GTVCVVGKIRDLILQLSKSSIYSTKPINTIRAWLGHVSLSTTLIYAEVDIEMKAQALKMCEPEQKEKVLKPWKKQNDIMAFLKSI